MAKRAARRKPEISRGEILDAALGCFAARGYHETSMDDIASRAGLSKGAIYWHFAGKRELFLALVDRFSEHALEALAAVPEAPDWRAALAAIFASVREQLESGMQMFRLGLEFVAQSAHDEEIRVRAERAQGVWKAAVEKQIARGVAAGTLRDVDAGAVGLLLDAAIDGLMLARMMRPDLDLEPAWIAAEEIFWRGLRA